MAGFSPPWKGTLFALSLVFVVFLATSEAGKSKNFILNGSYNPQDQPHRPSHYPSGSGYSRYRRNFRSGDETGPLTGFPGFSSPRRSSFNARKGGPRGFGSSGGPSGGFPVLGGPEAFLEPATTEKSDYEEVLDIQGFKFPGSGGFGGSSSASASFGSGRARTTRGRKGGAKGGGKGGGTDLAGSFSFGGSSEGGLPLPFGQEPPIKFPFTGPSAAGFSGSAGAKFSGFPGGSPFGLGQDPGGLPGLDLGGPTSAEFGGSASASSSGFRGLKGVKGPGFGGGSSPYFGGSPGSSPANRNPFGFPAPSITSFSGSLPSGGSASAGNPFGTAEFSSAGGGSAIFPQPGKPYDINSMFPQPIDSESPVVFPNNLPFDISEFVKIFDTVTTTPKPPNRVTSSEDINKVFSSSHEEEYDAEEEFYPVFGEATRKTPDIRRGCISKPAAPNNGRAECSNYSGCKAVCNRRYQFPGGEKRLFLECDEEDGEWKVAGDQWETLPDCIPICRPPCQNSGICLAPDVCDCPDNWEGATCEIPKSPAKKECASKPPTPMNSRILCSKDECIARCYEDFHFEEGVTRLTFKCLDGDWVIPNSRWTDTPDCEPICDPACINDGRCIAPNVCECTQEFRGPICQYPISNCDPKNLGFNGGYNCTGEGMEFGCALWCPKGVDFEFPPSDFYKCDYATSVWTPSPIPMCDYSFLSLLTPDPLGFPSINEFEMIPLPLGPKKSPGSCVTWSGSHYKTFDGKIYSFESSCPYTLVQDPTHGTFSINIKTVEGCEGHSCQKEIHIFLEDDQYILQATESGHPSLAYHDTSLAIPGQMNGVVSERVAHFVVIKVNDLGLTIKWDMQTLVIVEISELLWNRTSGLCGRRDANKENDWSYSDGTPETKISNFLQAWQAKTLEDRCLESPLVKSPCSRHSVSSQATTFCDRLKDDPRFDVCREVVEVEPYLSACRWDYCSCEGKDSETCACETFSAYFKECARYGVEIPGGWRSSDLCPMVCQHGKVYNPCMSAVQPRCGQPSDSVRPEFCVEGCDCTGDLVLHEGHCIDPKDCPCTYRSKEYKPGDTIPNDCNSCTCLGGEWKCTEVKCGSRCAAVGDPHYSTFDGRRYDFMGKCSYYLVQGDDFSIETENTPCAGAVSESMNFPASVVGQFPSCTKSVTIRLEGTVVLLKQEREVTVNGVELQELPTWIRGVYIKKVSSLFIMVELQNGLNVWWDGQTRVYVDAPAEFRGLTGGLCGTFTDNQRDDFLTPEGDVEQNAVAFANKWKTSEKCPDQPITEETRPCDRHVQNKAVAEKYCARLKSSLFASCHLEVDVEPYHRDCLYDMCSCETKLDGCLCPILAAYSKECARKGIIVDWRAEVRECGIHCTGGQKYQVCGNSCAHTCMDLAMNPDCKRKCVEGCNCLEGFTLDNSGICVPVTECPCIHEAKEYKPGYEMLQEQPDGSMMMCECFNAGWNCWEPTGNDTLRAMPQITCAAEQHLVYTDCMPDEEFTCQTMHLRAPAVDLCRAGCICEQGYVRDRDTGECIRHSQCPCHHGGRSYQEGETITEECNTCTCEGGQWLCTDTICPGICTAWGDSHYKTFDGRLYEFHGTCDYLLAKAKSSKADSFEVTIQNVPCGTDGVTCAKSVTLRVGSGDDQEVVKFSKNKPPPPQNLTRTIIREAGIFLFAEVSDMGLVLQWDKGTRAYLKLDPSWQGKVRGLCGNYNGDDQDDFMTPSGGSSEVSVRIFGDSWRLQNYCPDSYVIQDTCSLHPHRKVWASERCAILKSEVFAPCHSEVPVEPYVERCEFDACGCNTGGDCECLCTAIAAYGHECNIHGVYIKWRTPNVCPMQCDESCEHYEPCIPACPHETCDTFLDPSSPMCTQDACVEGCAKDICPPGYVHKSSTDMECVPVVDCEKRCKEIDGKVYMEGDIISQDDCHTCTCSRKKEICRGTPCETTPFLETTPRVSTPATLATTPAAYHKACNDGWSEWVSNDKPVIYRQNSDSETVPEKIEKSMAGRGWCEQGQIVDIKCRSVGTHRPHTEQPGVKCNLENGLLCQGRNDADVDEACWNYEVSFLCDCSIPTVETTTGTTPVTPAPPPVISTPAVPFITVSLPMTCEEEGWSRWYNQHFPDSDGEFELLSDIRKIDSLCPDHYISEVECRSVRSGEPDSVVTCDKNGALCRNSGSQKFCEDYEIRVKCQCECQDGLGMEDNTIPNDSITASSMMERDDRPYSARLNSKWAWTAKEVDEFNTEAIQSEWLQVDLGDVKEVTGVVTQGHPYYDQYVQRFAVQVSETGASWESVSEEGSSFAKQFSGNNDRNTPVTNLFPKPLFARYLRVVPMSFHSAISLRLEITGCNITKETTLPFEGITTPFVREIVVPECKHGWTDWMNTHTPGPDDWDDKDDLHTLWPQYQFCSVEHIKEIQCQVVGLGLSYQDAGQVGIVCNINNGLQCNDELQAPQHCFDYEVRFFCDCGLTTSTMSPFSSTAVYTTTPAPLLPCTRFDEHYKQHEDCRKFYECVSVSEFEKAYIEKECGPGTYYHPLTRTCDFEYNVMKIRKDCVKKPPPMYVSTVPSITTQKPTCFGDYWTEWFNVSHPLDDGGDYESFDKIREMGFEICDSMYIKDIQCEANKETKSEALTSSKGSAKGGRKGGHKGSRPEPARYSYERTDYKRTGDIDVLCNTEVGLQCDNFMQYAGEGQCQDYAIRVLCSCEATMETTIGISPTTPYVDIRGSTIITTPYPVVPVCPPTKTLIENAVPCENVCGYHRTKLQKNKECQRYDQYASACTKCPPGQYLRDSTTCVPREDCNCMLENGMSAPPGRVFRMSDCEVCQCSDNILVCSFICTPTTPEPVNATETPTFKCGEWSSWVSGEPSEETKDLVTSVREKHPDMCKYPHKIECRKKTRGTLSSFLPFDLTIDEGEKIACDRKCVKNPQTPGCEDMEVRFVCYCDEFQVSLEGLLTPPPPAPGLLTTLPSNVTVESTTYIGEFPTNVTTEYPPLNDVCVGASEYKQCAIRCDRVCVYYLAILKANGYCLLEDDCAPGCVEKGKTSTCPDSFYMFNESRCVAIADCNCRLPNGVAVPPEEWMEVSECENCMCQNNLLLCNTKPECAETTIEPEVAVSFLPTVAVPLPETTTININDWISSLIKCNYWTPFFRAQERNEEGLAISPADISSLSPFTCDKLTNATCREVSTNIPAENLAQTLVCDPKEGLKCRNLDNDEDCYNYEIAFFCYCEEEQVTTVSPPTTTVGSTTTLAACDAWSPWINERKPWQGDGDTEYKTLQQLREERGFCLEGHLADIQCVEAASGNAPSDEGVSCDVRFGFRCANSAQSRRTCLDYKIRYYCSCEATTVTTVILPTFFTPPPTCDPDKYINLLDNVEDSAFTSTPARNHMYGPSSARLYRDDGSLTTGGWSPYSTDRQQYVQVDLGSVVPVYGVEVAGNPLTRERVTSYFVQTSQDETTWSFVPEDATNPSSEPKAFSGPVVASQPLRQIFDEPIEARYVKIMPNQWQKAIAIRLEVIGCELPTTPPPVTTTGTEAPICEDPMGLENGEMSPNQIVVSSVLDDRESYYGKENLPLNSKASFIASAGAWVAKPKPDQYVRFNFLEPSKISGILTQGRSDSDDWVESFTVRYSPDGKTWNTILNPDGSEKVFPGNYDRDSVVKTKFDRVIQAQFLEIRPKTWNNNIAMRAEVLGCFHPYPEVTTTEAPFTTTLIPPPPYCDACPGLPEEFYDRCNPCSSGTFFDGKFCVAKAVCPCYEDGIRYETGSLFESSDCKECECIIGGEGEAKCQEKKCPPCKDENEYSVVTALCTCICKTCPEGTKLCPSSNYCLNETNWCNGIEDCPDDEVDCPPPTPEIPKGCPTKECPDPWVMKVQKVKGRCPSVTCELPEMTTPMPCPIPHCPLQFDIVFSHKKPGEVCPTYKCVPPITTMEPPTCPPPVCPDGYVVQESQDYEIQSTSSDDWCPHYQCIPPVTPTAPCPPPSCPQGYEVNYKDSKEPIELCPEYDCTPIITTTMCPPVECPDDLRVMYIESLDGSVCPQYSCVQITTPYPTTTETPFPECPPPEVPLCAEGETVYATTDVNDPCPKFGCKSPGVPPSEAPGGEFTCEVVGRTINSFDGSSYQLELCNHILAQKKNNKDWVISIHHNCSHDKTCDRYLKITQKGQQMILKPDLTIIYNDKSYTASQTQRIGTTTKNFTISRVGDTLYYESKVHNFAIEWNHEMNVKIEVGQDLKNNVVGMCGFYTGSANDDKTKPDGKLATSITDFGKSWSMDGDSCEPPKCNSSETTKAFKLCNMVQSKPFTECHSAVNTSPFLKTCVDEVCQCLHKGNNEDECRCQALNRYITSCLEKNPDAQLSDWRVVAKCYKKCEPGEVYHDCFRGKCERSCENLHDKEACVERESSCTSGCFCAPGLVRKGNKCVSPDMCRDCVCEAYGDPHYKSFDRYNFTFNGECSYVAARDKNIRGQHAFQVIAHNKDCSRVPVTVCTEAITVLYDSHSLHIGGDNGKTSVMIDGKRILTFPHREPWLALEQPDLSQVMASIPEIELEITFFEENHGFSIKIPSQLYFNKTEGLCGNCNYDDTDDLFAQDKGLVKSVEEFGRSWLNEGESRSCGVINKKEQACIPPPPDRDPCLKLMNEDIFGECHPIEDPAAYISACQLDSCNSLDPAEVACHSIEAYARRCTEFDVCLDWRSEDLCPKTCPEGLEYQQCGPGCVRTCDNYEELDKRPESCPISPVDGCFCPDDMVLDKGICVNTTYCTTCDDEGHRVGDVWKTDPCTTCQCNEHGSTCSTRTCPEDPICDEGYIIAEIPDTGDECCGPRKKCKVRPVENCTTPSEPESNCGYGKVSQLIEAPGKCPQYACVCLNPEDCPKVIEPEGDPNPGEEWVLDESGCCAQYVTKCNGVCPEEECPEFYIRKEQPLKEGQCCPEITCEIPKDACIYENRFEVTSFGFQRELTDEEEPEKKLYKIGESWEDGLCLKCKCTLGSKGAVHHQCSEQTCTTLNDHPDKGNYQLDMVEVAGQCCPSIVRTACIDDFEVIEVGSRLEDPVNGCRSVECVKTPEGKVEKIEQIFSCDESCSLGWVYEPSPLYPQQCCGTCVQVGCVMDDEVKEVGEIWLSTDLCTTYTCARDSKNQMQIQAVEEKCEMPSAEDKLLYVYVEDKDPNRCCSLYTKTACLMGSVPLQAGDTMQDPHDSCTSINCELASDGNVTRKEREITCDMKCSLGQTYIPPTPDSKECCGKCVQTHCVDDGIAHSIGEQWDSDGDKCYEYSCETRNDVLTTVAFKKDCPYFDPECPEEEIYMDEEGCCQLCKVKRPVKSDCKPNALSPEETVGTFMLKARGVGTCKNPNPISGLNQCSGHCDSFTAPVNQGGRRSSYVSTCFCCKPAKFEKILVEMVCDNGYKFTRAYDNIAECECLRCEDSIPEYQGDDPSASFEDSDLISLNGT